MQWQQLLQRDTLQNGHFSLLQYDDTELLLVGFRDTAVMKVTKEDFEGELIDLARHTPTLLINYFHDHAAMKSDNSDAQYAVYQLTIEKATVKLFINKHTDLLEKVSTMSNSDLYGDVTDVISYKKYTTAQNVLYPETIYISKTNGKVQDTVNINMVTTVKNVTPLLKKPVDYKWKDDQVMPPELSIEKYNDHIHFIVLKHTNGTAMVVEFKDFIVVTEAPLSSENGELIIKEARKIAPGKPIKYFVFTHDHPDYIGGMRAFIHKGATVLCTSMDTAYIQYLADAARTLQPDSLEQQRRPLQTEIFESNKTISDGAYEMSVYLIGKKSEHTDDYLVCATCKVVRLIVPFSLSEYSGTRFSVSGSLLRHAWLVTTGYEARRTMYRKLKSCLPQSDKRKNHRTSLMDRARLVGMANVK